jgi:hypothetical protein
MSSFYDKLFMKIRVQFVVGTIVVKLYLLCDRIKLLELLPLEIRVNLVIGKQNTNIDKIVRKFL